MIDLQQFCDTNRYDLRHPFSVGNYTYATNGAVAIRVPRIEGAPDGDELASYAKVIDDKLAMADSVEFRRCKLVLPEPPAGESKTCQNCYGSGHEHDCPECTCACQTCGGEGACRKAPTATAGVFGAVFAIRTLSTIADLPELALWVNALGDPSMFRFSGGIGALMSYRGRGEFHVENAATDLSADAQATAA